VITKRCKVAQIVKARSELELCRRKKWAPKKTTGQPEPGHTGVEWTGLLESNPVAALGVKFQVRCPQRAGFRSGRPIQCKTPPPLIWRLFHAPNRRSTRT
jgi:hypothetical protein